MAKKKNLHDAILSIAFAKNKRGNHGGLIEVESEVEEWMFFLLSSTSTSHFNSNGCLPPRTTACGGQSREATKETQEREFSKLRAVPDEYPKLVLPMNRLDLSEGGFVHRHLPDILLEELTTERPAIPGRDAECAVERSSEGRLQSNAEGARKRLLPMRPQRRYDILMP